MLNITLPRRSRPTAGSLRTVATFLFACLVVLAGATNANAASKITPAISLTASPTTIAPNKTSKLTVNLKASNKAVKSAAITVQERYQGTTKWVTRAKLTTSSSGSASTTTPKRIKNVEYRAVFAGSKTLAAKTSSTKIVAVAQSATITKSSATTVTAGATITLTGTTSPALAKHTASLQILSGKTWQTISKATVSSASAFTVSGKATQGGKKSYRVWVSGSTGIASANTATKTFNVYSWYYLSDLEYIEASNWDEDVDASVAGRSYPHSVSAENWADEQESASYNLSYRCSKLSATIGLDDGASSSTIAGFTAHVDDTADTNLGAFTVGRSKSVTLDTGGSFRLYLGNTFNSSGGWRDQAVWGNAKILCLTHP